MTSSAVTAIGSASVAHRMIAAKKMAPSRWASGGRSAGLGSNNTRIAAVIAPAIPIVVLWPDEVTSASPFGARPRFDSDIVVENRRLRSYAPSV